MGFNRVVRLSLASSLASLLSVSGAAVTTVAEPSANTVPLQTETLIAAASPVVSQGEFTKGEAPTTGATRIVVENGQRFLEIDGNFSTTDQAPDLHVLLDTTDTPPKQYTTFGSYVNLGKLQKFTGAQRYPIPDSVKLSKFKSVVIWCRMANATIGYATLK